MHLLFKPHGVDYLLRFLHHRSRAVSPREEEAPRPPCSGVDSNPDTFEDRHFRKYEGKLEGATHALQADDVGRQAGDVLTLEVDPAARRLQFSGDHVEKGRFPGSVRADDAPDFALLDAVRYPVDGDQSTEVP